MLMRVVTFSAFKLEYSPLHIYQIKKINNQIISTFYLFQMHATKPSKAWKIWHSYWDNSKIWNSFYLAIPTVAIKSVKIHCITCAHARSVLIVKHNWWWIRKKIICAIEVLSIAIHQTLKIVKRNASNVWSIYNSINSHEFCIIYRLLEQFTQQVFDRSPENNRGCENHK